MDPDLLARAIGSIDDANEGDPNRIDDRPLAQEQGRRAHEWVLRLDPEAGAALQLAARAHHLRRWELPRSDYPEGRDGYLRWRRDQKKRHAELLTTLLTADDIPVPQLHRAVEIVQKKGLGTDPEVQTFEDAVCLTFVETQFLATADKLADDDKMVDVVTKTLRKMSAAGIEAAGTITLDDRAADIVRRAAAGLS
ncbi:MAG: DUF4202 domain-containing protein [Acidimicrobiales bacterium]